MQPTILSGSLNGKFAALCVLKDRLDAMHAEAFKQDADRLLRDGPLNRIEVDLSRVEFIDSSGVGCLLSLFKRAPEREVAVKLTSVQNPVRCVIELLRLHRVFELQ